MPIGLTLRELIHHHGGGLIGGQALKAIATSGPSGGFLPPRIPARLLPRNFESKLPEAMRPWLVTPEGDLDLLGLPLDLQGVPRPRPDASAPAWSSTAMRPTCSTTR